MIYSSTADPLLGPPTTEAGVHQILATAAALAPAGVQAQAAFKQSRKDVWHLPQGIASAEAGEAKGSLAGYAKCIDVGGGEVCKSDADCPNSYCMSYKHPPMCHGESSR